MKARTQSKKLLCLKETHGEKVCERMYKKRRKANKRNKKKVCRIKNMI